MEISEDAIEFAIYTLAEDAKVVAEGAGAIGIGTLLDSEELRLRVKGKKVVVLVSGGNVEMVEVARILKKTADPGN